MTMGMTVQAVDAQSPTNCAPWVCIQEAPLVAPGVTSPAVPATFSVPLSSPVHRSRFGLIPCGTGRNSEFTVHSFLNFNKETPALTSLRRMIPELEISQSTKPYHEPKNYSLTHKRRYRLCCVQRSPKHQTSLLILAWAFYICTLSLFEYYLISTSALYHIRISMSLIKCQSYFILASSLDIFLMSKSTKPQLEDWDITRLVSPWKCICAKWDNIWAKCSGKWRECKFAPNKPWIDHYA